MADFVKLNGYDVKDVVSRNAVNTINNTLSGIKRPEDFGCVGDGLVDDTVNFQQALDGGGYILGTPNKNYRITSELRIPSNTVIDLNNSKMTADNLSHIFYNFTDDDVDILLYNGNGNITIKNGMIIGGAISFIHSHDVLIENVHFLNVNNDHIIEICACNNYTIKDCILEGLSNLYPSVREYINIDPCIYQSFPWLPEGSNTFDGTKNNNINILDNVFKTSTNANYMYMEHAIGCHVESNAQHSNINIQGNDIIGNADTSFAVHLMDMTNVRVFNNNISSKWGVFVEGCNYVFILNNVSICIDSTSRTFCVPGGSVPSYHVCISNNALINRSGYVIGGFTASGFTIDMLQSARSGFTSSGTTFTMIDVPITSVNKLTLQFGAVGGGNLSTGTIRSYLGRNFAVGESYPMLVKNGMLTITIDSEKQFSVTPSSEDVLTNCRQVILEKDLEIDLGA